MQVLAFLRPKSQMALILPNRFQLRTVENAKKNRQMATNFAPSPAPITEPKAVWARLVLLSTEVTSPT